MTPLKSEIHRISKFTVKTVRRIFIMVAGFTILLIGAVMIFLPGPGVLVMFCGLGLLAIEFVWARVWIRKLQTSMTRLQTSAKSLLRHEKTFKKPEDNR